MKILATNDLHQMASKWKDVVKACKKEKPDVLAIAGDLFPKTTNITGQFPFLEHLSKYAIKINKMGVRIILMLGNDDNQLLVPEMEKGEEDGLWYYAANKKVDIDGFEFVGMPYVPDYPFGYKFWCHPEFEDNLRISFASSPCIINEYNEFEDIPDMVAYMENKKPIWNCLEELVGEVDDVKSSIWLIHAPPSGVSLDICSSGDKVGSDAVLEFIEKYQPMLTLHGHIHESPEYNGHKWCQNIYDTLAIQGGQMGFDLYYSIIEIEGGKIVSKKHSIYK